MNPIRRIRRVAAVLAGLAAGLAAFGATPAFASVPRYGDQVGSSSPPEIRTVTHTVMLGGMPSWQIALIVAGTALIAAAVAVLADRAWSTRRKPAIAAA